jgi:ParB-like chromosome segregation protein Spo0J
MQKTSQIRIVYHPVAQLVPYARNARTHSDEQVDQIIESIRQRGWTNPVLVDGDKGIIAGHGRVLAARKMGIEEVPCIELGHMSQLERRAYVIADNKLALNAGWDHELLALELGELADEAYDVTLTGFTDEELTEFFGEGAGGSTVKALPVGDVADRFWISIRGPLAAQADTLQKIRALLEELPVDVELGTVNRDDELDA